MWTIYFTSSELVKCKRLEIGEPDIIQIRKVFDNAKSAQIWEQKVLRRMKVAKRTDFLNLYDGQNFGVTPDGNNPMKGRKHSEESKLKMKKPKTEEHKKNLSKSKMESEKRLRECPEYDYFFEIRSEIRKLAYQNIPEETKIRMHKAQADKVRGVPKPEGFGAKISKAQKGKKVYKSTIDKLKAGWVINGHPCQGCIWISNLETKECLKIHGDQFKDYEVLGFHRGRMRKSNKDV